MRVCLDLNVWCADVISRRKQHHATAARVLVEAVKAGVCARGPLSLIISLGMLERLSKVLTEDIGFDALVARTTVAAIAALAEPAPSLTLGGVGILRMTDLEDQHVLETAWAGRADLLVTANVRDFDRADADIRVPNRIARLTRACRAMILAHPYAASAWLDGRDVGGWPDDRG
jgi:predicted nucleic acid-binding protein